MKNNWKDSLKVSQRHTQFFQQYFASFDKRINYSEELKWLFMQKSCLKCWTTDARIAQLLNSNAVNKWHDDQSCRRQAKALYLSVSLDEYVWAKQENFSIARKRIKRFCSRDKLKKRYISIQIRILRFETLT